MEYPKRLQNLNLQELAFVFEIPYETMLRVTSQKKELHARDIPVIVTYGDLMRMASLSMKAAEKMLNVTKGEAEPASLVVHWKTVSAITAILALIVSIIALFVSCMN